jgi:nucleoid-associated protein YgaU
VTEAGSAGDGSTETIGNDAASTSSGGTAETKMTVHKIAPGDTFSHLAKKYLGDVKYANLIVKANPKLDPNRLQLGAEVNIPALVEPTETVRTADGERVTTATPGTGASTTSSDASGSDSGGSVAIRRSPPDRTPPVPADRAYTVKEGDSWYQLAEKFLGSGSEWPRLYELNRERVANNQRNLRPGTVIEVPAKGL